MKCFLMLFLASTVSVLSAFDCPEVQQGATAQKGLFQGQQKFTIDLLSTILKDEPEHNVFFSSYSIYRALLLAYFGSQGTVENLLSQKLYLDWSKNKNEVITSYHADKTKRKELGAVDSGIEFETSDRFFFDKGVNVRECIQNVFRDDIEMLNIHEDSEGARKHINKWVEDTTKQYIKDLLPVGSISPATVVAIANGAFFKAFWSSQFKVGETKKELFYKTPDTTVEVDMMRKESYFEYLVNEKVGFKALKLGYNSKVHGVHNIDFALFLPLENKVNALEEMVSKMTSDVLKETLHSNDGDLVELKLPKFVIEEQFSLKKTFVTMGLGEFFEASADFSGFSEKSKIKMDEIYHKAKIEVDEYGTKAAAGTVIVGVGSGAPAEPKVFHANRPFMFMIYDHNTEAVLFSGVFRGSSLTS